MKIFEIFIYEIKIIFLKFEIKILQMNVENIQNEGLDK